MYTNIDIDILIITDIDTYNVSETYIWSFILFFPYIQHRSPRNVLETSFG